MKRFTSWLITFSVILTLFFGSMFSARADMKKPIITFSFAGYNAFIQDFAAVGKLADNPSLGSMLELPLQLFLGDVLDAMDKNAPFGGFLLEDEGEYHFLAFLPFKNKDAIVDFLSSRGANIDVEVLDDGIVVLSADSPNLYLKESGGFLYISSEKATLEDLPEDPVMLLEGLNKKYTLAVKFHLDHLSPETKNWFFSSIEEGMDLVDQLSQDDENSETLKASMENNKKTLALLKKQIEAFKKIEIGYSFDKNAGELKLGGVMEFQEGSSMANLIAKSKNLKSQFAGFVNLDIIGSGYQISMNDEETLATARDSLDSQWKVIKAMMRQSSELGEEEKEKLEKFLDSARDLLDGMVVQEVSDAGFLLDMEPGNITGLLVFTVNDAQKFLASVKTLAEMGIAEGILSADQLKLDVAWERGAFHRGEIPFREIMEKAGEVDEDALALFEKFAGETLIVTVGTDGEKFFLGYGNDAIELLKKGTAESAEEAQMAKFQVSALRILQYTGKMVTLTAEKEDRGVAQVKYVLRLLREILAGEPGKDHLRVEGRILNDTTVEANYVLEKGIVKILGSLPNIYIMLQMADDEDFEDLDEE